MRSGGLLKPAGRGKSYLRTGRSWNWTAFASLLAALAAAAGVVFTGLSLQATRAQNTVNEQGQLTDRFTKAVDQLDRAGTDHLQARLGAIYALERLARDSPRDHPTIVEVLSAFIRTNTPEAATTGPLGTDVPCPDHDVTPDINAALVVLGRRDVTRDATAHVDLQRTCLIRAQLANANLSGADLGDADLTDTDLTGANLTNADLRYANLTGANLTGANLTSVDLRYAHLTGANLTGANLTIANLNHADLSGAHLTDADLSGADLTGVVFGISRSAKTDLTGANLSGANLLGADLTGTDLSDTDLTNADLRYADLTGTDLRYADLTGTDLTNARHNEKTVVDEALVDERTKGAWWR